MGNARWNKRDWSRYSGRVRGRRTEEIFVSEGLDPGLNPMGALRESRDSALNPRSTALIVGLDVTGSMGMIADALAREGLGTLVGKILERQPIPDPHTMIIGIGDLDCDSAPLQATQFEADIRIAEQLQRIWLEKGGGGNDHESYTLAWYFAAMHTATDCWDKRRKKGYLFTVGDEEPNPWLNGPDLAVHLGAGPTRSLPAAQLLRMAEERWEVFHVIIEEGSYASAHPQRVARAWRDLLGQRALPLANHRRLAELIVSTIEVNEGRDPAAAAGAWSGDTAEVVGRALALMAPH